MDMRRSFSALRLSARGIRYHRTSQSVSSCGILTFALQRNILLDTQQPIVHQHLRQKNKRILRVKTQEAPSAIWPYGAPQQVPTDAVKRALGARAALGRMNPDFVATARGAP